MAVLGQMRAEKKSAALAPAKSIVMRVPIGAVLYIDKIADLIGVIEAFRATINPSSPRYEQAILLLEEIDLILKD